MEETIVLENTEQSHISKEEVNIKDNFEYSTLTGVANQIVKNIVGTAYGDMLPDLCIYRAVRSPKADYQFGQIGAIAKLLNLNPKSVAETVHDLLFQNDLIEFVETVYTGKQIFVIFNFKLSYLEHRINNLYSEFMRTGQLPPPVISNLSSKVLIDFSSPNVAKEMHVGHLRSTIIGESLARIMEWCGSRVQRINHIGDWGTQFGMLIAYIKRIKIYSYDLDKLMEMYKESRKLFDTDDDFKQEAHSETVLLQQGLPENISIWENIREISLKAFDAIYEQLGTKLEVKGESFYQSRMVQLVHDLDEKLIQSYGMKVIFATKQTIPYILIKSDGGFTYDTSDLAALRYRIEEERADQVIYVIDSSQKQHMDILFQLAQDLGWANKSQLVHVGFGLVLGLDGKKICTRAGQSAKLRDLLSDAYDHALNTTRELAKSKHPDWCDSDIEFVSKKIAVNCIKYEDLSNPRLSNYKFSLDKMLNVKGNTGVYLMYALARCKSILRNVPNCDNIVSGEISLTSPQARNLAFKLIKYLETIEDSANQLCPHHICNYLYDLAGLITHFYKKNRCIDFDKDGSIIKIHEENVRLINLTIQVMAKLFYLVGLDEIEKI